MVLLTSVSAVAQDVEQRVSDSELDLAQRTLPLDIRTATYFELSAWCRRLGLSTQGSRTELQQRLENYYKIPPTPKAEEEVGNRISIDEADRSRYFSLEELDETYLHLLGGVVVTMEGAENDTRHTIKADRIIYNQGLNSLTASGNLEYFIDQEGKIEKFTGESLTFSLDNWQGVFIQGTSSADRDLEEEQLTFYYTGRTIYRLADDTVILKQGTITSSNPEDPYYHVDADRIWLLAPDEWALRNAVLYVGHVPLFYFPFFFHPGNELVFHPATGFREIEGFFIQTTTYFIGERKRSSSSLSFLQVADDVSENYNKELWGIFLKKTEPIEATEEPVPEEQEYLKLFFDMYTRFGVAMGLEGHFFEGEALEVFDFWIGAARSRNLVQSDSGTYEYLYRNEDGTYNSIWNNSQFLGLELPLRYGAGIEISLNIAPLTLRGAVPLYSDPWYRRDFYHRTEEIDWASLLGIEEDETDEGATAADTGEGKKDRFQWLLSSRLSPRLSNLRPYIQSMSLSRLDVSMSWRAKALPAEDLPEVITAAEYRYPEREFFMPESVVLPSLSGRITGTILPISQQAAARDRRAGRPQDDDESIVILPPWEVPEEGEGEEQASDTDAQEAEEEVAPILRVPKRIENAPMSRPQDVPFYRHSLSYSLAPDLSFDSRMNTSQWLRPEDIDFQTEYSILSTRATGSIQYSSDVFEDYLDFKTNLNLSTSYKMHYSEDEASVTNWEILTLQDRAATFVKLTNTSNVAFYPLLINRYLDASSMQYALSSTLFQRTFNSQLEDYEDQHIEWDKELITAHNVILDVVYAPTVGRQSLKWSFVMPPLDPAITANLASQLGPFRTTINGGLKKEENATEWEGDPLTVAERFTFLGSSYIDNALTYTFVDDSLSVNRSEVFLSAFDGNLVLKETFTYDFLLERPTESTSSLTLWWFTALFQATNTVDYEFIAGQGWKSGGEEDFRPTRFSSSFVYRMDEQKYWYNRIKISGGVDASWNINLIRVTDSTLSLGLKFDLAIAEFLTFSFASNSLNKASYRYIPALSRAIDDQDPINPIADIGRSFNFFNRQDRVTSFFNLENISSSLVHNLGDWDLELEYSGEPELVEEGGISNYEWSGKFSLFVRWKPIPEIKRRVRVESGELEF
ncbi:MAG: hypothetical protein CMN78_01270 [Spirochaetales bacterium]|nr:hypothetical protein [Spirochaetales bacterium]